MQQLMPELLTRKKQTAKKLRKAFKLKLLELCKTRADKSSPDMFNFYVVSAWHDIFTDTGRATICRRKFRTPSLQTKRTKNEGHYENIGFNAKQIENFRRKKYFWPRPNNDKKHTAPQRQQLTTYLVNRKKSTEKKLKNHSGQNCWIFAILELRSHVLTCSTCL